MTILIIGLLFCHLSELNWLGKEGSWWALPVPRYKWEHTQEFNISIDLDKEDIRPWAQQICMTQSFIHLRTFLFWLPSTFVNTLVFTSLFKHLSCCCLGHFCSLVSQLTMHFLLLRVITGSPGLPEQRRGLLEALSHLLREKLVTGGNDSSWKWKELYHGWVLPGIKCSPWEVTAAETGVSLIRGF